MSLPGYTAEAAAWGSHGFFRMRGLETTTRAEHRVTMATQCCPPGYDTTGCTQGPQDCTTKGCPQGLYCCDCVSPAVCTTLARCRNYYCRL
jgi:hypothetical protein